MTIRPTTRRRLPGAALLALAALALAALAAPAAADPPVDKRYAVTMVFDVSGDGFGFRRYVYDCWRFRRNGKITSTSQGFDGRYAVIERFDTTALWNGTIWINQLPGFRARAEIQLAASEFRHKGTAIGGTFTARVRGDEVPGGGWVYVNGSFSGDNNRIKQRCGRF